MTALPTLFVSHGSPEFALRPERLGPALTALGRELTKPRAVLALSPHWMSRRLEVQATPQPATVHDFGGFSPALYALEYPAPGAPAVAAEVAHLLAQGGFAVSINERVGRDHGVWVPLLHLYPEADVPVLQIAQPASDDPRLLLELGRALAPLRQQGVLIVGSGGLTHNLYDFRSAAAGQYVGPFSAWIAAALAAGDLDALLDYRRRAPGAERAHPTDEHLLPLFFAIGAAGDEWKNPRRLEGGVSDAVLAMDSFVFAAPKEDA